ncbi:MAG: glycoside hydrolase family 97 protein [Bacteroidota bacterium]
MKTFNSIFCLFFFIISIPAIAQKKVSISSPDKSLQFSFRLINGSANYDILFKGKNIIETSPLSLQFENENFDGNILMRKPVFKIAVERYELPVGKAKYISDTYNEVVIPLEKNSDNRLTINLVVRAFNHGIAFRYEILKQSTNKSFVLQEENTSFQFKDNPIVHALFLPNYTSSHEGPYTSISLKDIKNDTLMDMPALFECSNKVYVAITEAALTDYAGMYLSKKNGKLVSTLSPLPNQTVAKVKASFPHKTPWRVIMLSDGIGDLFENNIITDLNEPCAIDTSWIRPGKTTFPWWNGNVTPDTLNAPGNNFVTQQYYIDFCARNKIEYHTVVEYGLHQWYTDDGVGFSPGPNNDVTKPVPGLDMKEVCDYAATKGVGVRVWVHWAALYPRLDSAFAIFERWGLKGMMIDFMDRDDQEMVNIQTEMLQKAAAHHLHIQFHGAYKPTGLHRTYPNEFTREGTMNYEVNKWDKRMTAEHDLNIVFMRMLAGSTDYHLGGFRAVPDSLFKVQYTRPLMLGTRCHMLALYVVFENYLQMVCDYPAAYEGEPGFEFIQQVPTVWDEIKVPAAELNKYITVARRKGNDWYVGTINNNEEKTVQIPLSFLSNGKYSAEIYSDANDVAINPNHIKKEEKLLTGKDKIAVRIAAGGGSVLRIRKIAD